MVLTSEVRANSIVMVPSRAPYRTRSPEGLNHASVPSGPRKLHTSVTAPSRASMADVLPTPLTPASNVNEWSSGRSSLAMPLKFRTFSDRTCGYGGMTVVPGSCSSSWDIVKCCVASGQSGGRVNMSCDERYRPPRFAALRSVEVRTPWHVVDQPSSHGLGRQTRLGLGNGPDMPNRRRCHESSMDHVSHPVHSSGRWRRWTTTP